MASIGEWVTLKVLRKTAHGLLLEAGGDLGEVLLPGREMPRQWSEGGWVEVFLYHDSEDRPVATTKRPKAMPGEFAYLEVLAITPVGAFLDWGLAKDLMLPFREQKERLEVGRSYVVHVHVDPESGRIVASRRLNRFLKEGKPPYREGQEVELLLYGKTPLGYKALVNGAYSGVLYANEVFRRLRAGEKTKGYVAKVREDGKLDLSLYAPGRERVVQLEERLVEELKKRGGFWAIGDDTPAEVIHRELGVSKKAFKQAVGALYRLRRISVEEGGVRLSAG